MSVLFLNESGGVLLLVCSQLLRDGLQSCEGKTHNNSNSNIIIIIKRFRDKSLFPCGHLCGHVIAMARCLALTFSLPTFIYRGCFSAATYETSTGRPAQERTSRRADAGALRCAFKTLSSAAEQDVLV